MKTERIPIFSLKKSSSLFASMLYCFLVPYGVVAQNQHKIDSLLQVLKLSREDTSRVLIYLKLAEEGSDYSVDTEIDYANKAMQLAEKLNYQHGQAMALSELSIAASISGDYQKALDLSLQANKYFLHEGSSKALFQSYQALAANYGDLGDFKNALTFCLKANAIANQVKEKEMLITSEINLGILYKHLGDYDSAMFHALNGLKVSEQSGDKQKIAYGNFAVAYIYESLDNVDEALEYYRRAVKLDEEIGDKETALQINYSIAGLYKNAQKLDEARKYYDRSLAMSLEMPEPKWIAGNYAGIGEVCRMQGKNDSALTYLGKSMTIFEQIRDSEGISETYYQMGMVYFNNENYSEAIKATEKTVAIDKETGATEHSADNFKLLANCYSQTHDFQNAFTFLSLYATLKDSLQNEDAAKRTEELEKKYQSEKKEKEIAVLNKNKELQTAEIKKQTILKNSFIGGAALLLLLLFFSYGYYRARQRLKLQSIRNKIASDLHDDIGSTLNSISVYSEVAKQDPSRQTESLDMIGEASRKVIEAMSDIVWSINPTNDSFENIILRMRSLAYNLLRAKNIEHSFRADEHLDVMKLSMEQRRNFYLIFKEVINNLVKYSNADQAKINIIQDHKFITLTIADNGKGFDIAKQYNGNGLNNMKQRAEEIHAVLNIESFIGEGTTVELKLKSK